MRLAWLGVPAVFAILFTGCGHGADQPDAGPDGAPTDASPDAVPIDAAIAPVFRNPVGLADLPLAQQAAALLRQGGAKTCNACHAVTQARLREWDDRTDLAETSCLTSLTPTTPAAAQAILDCLRGKPGGDWHPTRLGIHTTAAGLPWFEYVFRLAHGAAWEAPFAAWRGQVEMPRGDRPTFTQPEFDVVAEWFARDLPHLDTVIPVGPTPPPCTTTITPAIATHVGAMTTAGWRALNRDDRLPMFGCQGAATPGDCLSTYPLASSQPWGATWTAVAPATRIKLLREIDYDSSYWTRSSADGRFVGHGGSSGAAGSTVIDLAQDREIPTDASFDPGFFPDNSGFVFQGNGTHYCKQSLLTRSPARITFAEPECTTIAGVGLYQHIGAVRGGDYWTVHGQFVADNGGGRDPGADFEPGAQNHLTPMIHDGQRYRARPMVAVTTPNEGDTVIAPSSKLLVSRTGDGNGAMSGFVVRQLLATVAGDSYDVQVPVIGTYCVRGAKPAVSFDERWLVYHHNVAPDDWASLGYASGSDPAFTALVQQGTANLFVLDLTTGRERRITTMAAGQLALFPHFRSDGWIYAIVKDRARGREVIIASDAALVFEQP